MSKTTKDTNLRQKLSRLEKIAELLEAEDLEIEQSITLYEEGVKLSTECYKMLKDAELKIQTLSEHALRAAEDLKEN